MPEFRDAEKVKWRVRRLWWPLLGAMDMASGGSSTLGLVLFVIAIPMILAWPFWLLLKFCGVSWKVVTERDGEEVAREKVSGWRASGRRIEEIVADIRARADGDGGVEMTGVEAPSLH
ncbi:hypothetical protein BH11ACT7_BH11ACT7_19650 [soil metagenome]